MNFSFTRRVGIRRELCLYEREVASHDAMAPRRTSRSPARARPWAAPITLHADDQLQDHEDALREIKRYIQAREDHFYNELYVCFVLCFLLHVCGAESRPSTTFEQVGSLITFFFLVTRPVFSKTY